MPARWPVSRVLSDVTMPARWPVSRVLCRARERGDGHPSRVPVTRHLKRPTRGRGDAPLPRPEPRTPSYLALHRVELARFTPARRQKPPAGSSLWRWSSPRGGRALPATPRRGARTFLVRSGRSLRTRPSGHLAGTLHSSAGAPTVRRQARLRPGSRPRGAPPRPGRRARGWRARRRPGSWRAARGGALQRSKPASMPRAPARGATRSLRVLDAPAAVQLLDDEHRVEAQVDRLGRRGAAPPRAPAASAVYSATLLVWTPSGRATTASGGASGSVGAGPVGVDEHRPGRGRSRVAARGAVGPDEQAQPHRP